MEDIYYKCDENANRLSLNLNAHFTASDGLSISISDVEEFDIKRGDYICFSDCDVAERCGIFRINEAYGGGAFIVSKM